MFDEKIEAIKNDLIKTTQEIIRVKSVKDAPGPAMPFGKGVNDALEKTLLVCKNLGFRTCNMDGYIGYAEFGEGEEFVTVLGHLDVVPEGDGWIYPPYAAEIHDDKIYGRGTLDDKGPMMSALYAAKAVMDSGVKLSKRVRLIFGADEESGWEDINHYKEVNGEKPAVGFTPDGNFPIIHAEKGIINIDLIKDITEEAADSKEYIELVDLKGGQRPNMVADYCKAVLKASETKFAEITKAYDEIAAKDKDLLLTQNGDTFEITAHGVGAHGSTPEKGKSAISLMIEFLSQLNISNKDIKNYINFLHKNIGYDTDGNGLNVKLHDDVSGNLTLNFGIISMENKKIVSTFNLRVPVTFTTQEVIDAIDALASKSGIQTGNLYVQEPLHVDKNHYLIKTLQKVYQKYTGEEATLLSIGGGTYAKAFENVVAFGPIFPGGPDLDHQPNEYIEIKNLVLSAKIYAEAIYELAK